MNKFALGIAAVIALSQTPVRAADMAVKTSAPAVKPAMNWTGCYVGFATGGQFGTQKPWSTGPGVTNGQTLAEVWPDGVIVGGTVGCNYQSGIWVVGIEDDLFWTQYQGGSGDLTPIATTVSHQVKANWLDTLRARWGVVTDPVPAYFYLTGGVAFSRLTDTVTGLAAGTFSNTSNVTGWVAGIGAEFLLWPQITVKAEYNFIQFPSVHDSFNVASGGAYPGDNAKTYTHVMKLGMNYLFNSYSAPAVYK
jgi:outer membrane immunogenic protein